jgi:hypothetical protein
MANPEHLEILRKGVSAWNKWRIEHPETQPGLVGADLSGAKLRDTTLDRANLSGASLNNADLSGADLSGANLSGASLNNAYLIEANLSSADLRGAYLIAANFSVAYLCGADLSDAYLIAANLSEAHLSGADFTGASFSGTMLATSDLSQAKGLESVHHRGPSAIGIDTFFLSGGNIPEVFLRGAGVPDDFLQYAVSLAGTPFEFYSAFISYSSKDDDFAKRLYADLQAKGVRCWFFPDDAKWGEPKWGEIDVGIRIHDKLVVICSEHSLQSGPVLREIERALQREDREHKSVLFPVRIDDYIFDKWEHPRKADVVEKVVGDMRNWKDHDSYQNAFKRLLRDFKAKA